MSILRCSIANCALPITLLFICAHATAQEIATASASASAGNMMTGPYGGSVSYTDPDTGASSGAGAGGNVYPFSEIQISGSASASPGPDEENEGSGVGGSASASASISDTYRVVGDAPFGTPVQFMAYGTISTQFEADPEDNIPGTYAPSSADAYANGSGGAGGVSFGDSGGQGTIDTSIGDEVTAYLSVQGSCDATEEPRNYAQADFSADADYEINPVPTTFNFSLVPVPSPSSLPVFAGCGATLILGIRRRAAR